MGIMSTCVEMCSLGASCLLTNAQRSVFFLESLILRDSRRRDLVAQQRSKGAMTKKHLAYSRAFSVRRQAAPRSYRITGTARGYPFSSHSRKPLARHFFVITPWERDVGRQSRRRRLFAPTRAPQEKMASVRAAAEKKGYSRASLIYCGKSRKQTTGPRSPGANS